MQKLREERVKRDVTEALELLEQLPDDLKDVALEDMREILKTEASA